MKLYNNDALALNYFTAHPLAFLADSVVTKIDSTANKSSKTLALLDSIEVLKYGAANFSVSLRDTIIFKKFEPQHFLFEVNSKKSVGFILQQNLTKLWHVYVDGIEVKPALCYYSFPFIKLEEGKHLIEFSYQVPHYRLYFGLSLLIFSACMMFILFHFNYKWPALTLFIGVLIFCLFKFYNGNKNRSEEKINELQQQILNDAEYKGNVFYIMNTRDVYFENITNSFAKFNFIYQEDVASSIDKLSKFKGEYLLYTTYKTYAPPEVLAIIKTNFGALIKEEKNKYGFTAVFKRSPQNRFILCEKNFHIPATDPNGIELKKGKEYSPTFEFKAEDCKAGKYDLLFAEAEIESDFSDFKGLCLSMENNGKNKKFQANGFIHHTGLKKQRLCFYYRLPETTKPADLIKIFVWNNDERPLLLKDLKVKVISRDVFSQR